MSTTCRGRSNTWKVSSSAAGLERGVPLLRAFLQYNERFQVLFWPSGHSFDCIPIASRGCRCVPGRSGRAVSEFASDDRVEQFGGFKHCAVGAGTDWKTMLLFSVVIPTFNRARLRRVRRWTPVFAQEFTDFEVIVIDDGSTDETPAVLADAAAETRRAGWCVQQENKGVCAGPKRSGTACRPGDTSRSSTATTSGSRGRLQARACDPGARLAGPEDGPAGVLQGRGSTAGGPRRHARDLLLSSDLFTRLEERWVWIGAGGTVVRADVAEAGGWPEKRINAEDLDLLLRMGTGFRRGDGSAGVRLPAACRHPVPQDTAISFDGYSYVFDQERAGHFPGGRSRHEQRRRVISERWPRHPVSVLATGEVGLGLGCTGKRSGCNGGSRGCAASSAIRSRRRSVPSGRGPPPDATTGARG